MTGLHGSGPVARNIGGQRRRGKNGAKYGSGEKNSSSHACNSTARDSVTLVWSHRYEKGRRRELGPARLDREVISRPDGDLGAAFLHLSLIHISEPTRLGMISY